jgi:hypothetical protein
MIIPWLYTLTERVPDDPFFVIYKRPNRLWHLLTKQQLTNLGLPGRQTRLQNARSIGSARAGCNEFASLSADQRRHQNALTSLD